MGAFWSPALVRVGDERGIVPDLASNEEAIELVLEAIERAGYRPGTEIALSLDAATSEMWRDGAYVAFKSDQSVRTTAQMIELWIEWIDRYPDCADRGRTGRERLGRLGTDQ